uniref:Cadherin domain-containing protein n=1 Tax=Trichobilharzia regenti TaxID=157069 RepID=A0AA85KB29_TRIRE|nr:unnamed protein product [Trichobilharzia regenti]
MLEETGQGRMIVKYSFQVPECINQRQLLRLNANDMDEADSEFGRVSYHLSDQTQNFEQLRQRLFISGEYIYLTDLGLKDLNQANLTLIVTATDGAGRSSDAWIHLLVQDCNDHKPMIIMRNTEFSVVENAIGNQQLVSLITVRDLDLTTSPNSEFQCSLNDTAYLSLVEVMSGPKLSEPRNSNGMNLNSRFLFHRQQSETADNNDGLSRQGRWVVYRLETKNSSSFDREATPYYNVLLQCSDKGSPMLTSHRLITINILDVNDNPPIFLNSQQSQSPHLSLLNTDSHRKLFYQSYLSSNPQRIDQSYTYQFVLPENSLRGTIIGSVQAIDLDAGENGRLNFELKSQIPYFGNKMLLSPNEIDNMTKTEYQNIDDNNSDNEGQRKDIRSHRVFNLAANGEIQLIDEVDREKVDRYELYIVVSDNAKTNRLSSTATVIIKIEDVNDCRPEFFGDYVFEIVESYGSSTIHQILGSVVATDMDLGRNGSITYRLSSEQDNNNNHNNLVGNKIHGPAYAFNSRLIQISHDGKLTVYGVIDREKTPVIILTVIAEDNGIPMKLSNSVTVTVHVLDLNDNKPRFIESSALRSQLTNKADGEKNVPDNPNVNFISPVTGFKLNLSLDTNVGTLLTVFEAYDPDNGPNGTVVFDMAYSGTLGFSNEIKSHKSGGSDEESASVPTFTLQPDGRLLLSKRLIYSDMISPAPNNLPKRYRRPDRLLIRVSDKGPTPEQSITSLQIFYYDPIETIQNTYSENYAPTSNRKNDIKSDHEYSTTNQNTENGNNKYFAYKSNVQTLLGGREGGKLSSKSFMRSSELTHSKPFTLPAMYLLALAVCLALLLVIISFACFYVKVRKTNIGENGQEKYDSVVKTDVHGDTLNNNKKNVDGDIRLDNTLTCHSKKELDESQTFSGSGNKMISDCGMNSLNYRSLSPTYIVRGCDHVNFLPSNDAYVDTVMSMPHWTMNSSHYTPLSISQINSATNSYLPSTISHNDSRKQFVNSNQNQLENPTSFKTPDSLYEDQSSPVLFNKMEFSKTLNRQTQYNLLMDNQMDASNIISRSENNDKSSNSIGKTFQTDDMTTTATNFVPNSQNTKSIVMPPKRNLSDKSILNTSTQKYNELKSASETPTTISASVSNNSDITLSAMQKSKCKLFTSKKNEISKSQNQSHNQTSDNDTFHRLPVSIDLNHVSIIAQSKSSDLPQLTSSFV